MKALIIVDLQNDFCPGGALPAPGGHTIVPLINTLMDNFDIVIASNDLHPQHTQHFNKWPPHCIKNSKGADFHPKLDTSKIHKVFIKGTGEIDDGYSAFEATNEDLKQFLLKNKIDEVFVTGLTTEYCVKNTALDSIRNGFRTYIFKDAVAAVKPESENEMKAIKEMEEAGVTILRTDKEIK